MLTFELTQYEQEELESLRGQLETLEANFEKKSSRYITGEQMNPVGEIGGIRSRSRRQKNRIMNQYDKQAKETVSFMDERSRLQKRIANLETKPEKEERCFKLDLKRLAWWDSLKAGDTFQPGNNPLEIKKKNRMSVITANGTKWTIHELTGLSKARIAQLREHLDSQ